MARRGCAPGFVRTAKRERENGHRPVPAREGMWLAPQRAAQASRDECMTHGCAASVSAEDNLHLGGAHSFGAQTCCAHRPFTGEVE